MRLSAILLLILTLVSCAPTSMSHSIGAESLLNTTTVGGPDYPIIIEGAESIGLNPSLIAQNLRFPASLSAGSNFRAITRAEAPSTHAHLFIAPGQPLAPATLTFVHGTKRIGVGTFAIPQEAYRDPQALGSASAVLIIDMLNEAQSQTRRSPFFLRRFF